MYTKFLIWFFKISTAHAALIPDPNQQGSRITQSQPGDTLNVTLQNFENRATSLVFYLFGALAIIFLVIVGLQYMSAGGNPEKVKKARQALIQVIAGLGLFLLTYFTINLIVSFVQALANN